MDDGKRVADGSCHVRKKPLRLYSSEIHTFSWKDLRAAFKRKQRKEHVKFGRKSHLHHVFGAGSHAFSQRNGAATLKVVEIWWPDEMVWKRRKVQSVWGTLCNRDGSNLTKACSDMLGKLFHCAPDVPKRPLGCPPAVRVAVLLHPSSLLLETN